MLRVLALAAIWPVVFLAGAVAWWAFGSDSDKPTASVLPLWLVAVVATVVMVVGGCPVAGREPAHVLYLRRFGDTESTRTVTAAVSRIGGYWRIVTLDDGRVTPVGVRGGRALDTANRWGRRGHTVITKVWGTIYAVLLLAFWAIVGLALAGHTDRASIDRARRFIAMQTRKVISARLLCSGLTRRCGATRSPSSAPTPRSH